MMYFKRSLVRAYCRSRKFRGTALSRTLVSRLLVPAVSGLQNKKKIFEIAPETKKLGGLVSEGLNMAMWHTSYWEKNNLNINNRCFNSFQKYRNLATP